MAFDDTKSTFQTQQGVPADEKLTASEWNTHVTDQENRGYNNLTTVTADHTAESQQIVLVDASSNNVTVTLPSPESSISVVVKRTDSSTNTVTIATPGSETIDGSSSVTLSNQYDVEEIVSDGTDYFLL